MSAPRRSARPTPRVDEATRGAVVEVDRSDAATSTTRPRRWRFDALPYVLVAPVAIFIVGLAIVPALFTIIESFFTVDELNPPTRFAGLGNFVQLLHNHAVTNSAVNTVFYVVVGVTLSTALGMAMAVLLQRPFRGRGLVIAILILPWALPGVVEGILWSGIFDPNAGLINSLIATFHLGAGDGVLLGQNRLLTVGLIGLVQPVMGNGGNERHVDGVLLPSRRLDEPVRVDCGNRIGVPQPQGEVGPPVVPLAAGFKLHQR